MKNKRKKIQILFIHGGMTFKKQKDYVYFLKTRKISIVEKVRWSNEFLKKHLGKQFAIIKPSMPLKENAKYAEWQIHFERHVPHLRSPLILIGNSLGGIFLAKYLSEHVFSKKILSTYLICPPFDDSLSKEDLAGGFQLKSDLSLLQKNSKNLYLLFSKDDDIVPVTHAKKYRKKLKNAKILIYKNKHGHFQISKFPEIITMIKNDVKKYG